MTEPMQRGIAQELHRNPINWSRPRQPDQIECGVRRYYPEAYERVYQWCVVAIYVVVCLILLTWK